MSKNEYIKGTLRTIILKLLSENDKLYGYQISQKVEELTDNEIKLTYGALYPILYKLENEGLLSTSTEVVDNRARKYYSLTGEGESIAIEKIKELKRFAENLSKILEPKTKTQFGLESWAI